MQERHASNEKENSDRDAYRSHTVGTHGRVSATATALAGKRSTATPRWMPPSDHCRHSPPLYTPGAADGVRDSRRARDRGSVLALRSALADATVTAAGRWPAKNQAPCSLSRLPNFHVAVPRHEVPEGTFWSENPPAGAVP